MIAADASRSAGGSVGGIGRVCERVVVRAAGWQWGSVVRGSVQVRERVVVRAPGRQWRQRVNPRHS